MLKYAFLGATMIVAAPILAQTAPVPSQNSPAVPAATADTAQPAAVASAQAVPQSSMPAPVAAAAQPATTGTQVAQVVNTEFAAYDRNGDGTLSMPEFATWMVVLKTASDPATKADSPATKAWIAGAFAQADKDKSKSISKDELTGFLSQGKS